MLWPMPFYNFCPKTAVTKVAPRLWVPINGPRGSQTVTRVRLNGPSIARSAIQLFSKGNNMKTYEVLSETQDGTLVAVVSTEAKDAVDAMRQTANFCDMMDIEVHSIREVK